MNTLVYDDLQMTNVKNAIYFTEYYPDISRSGHRSRADGHRDHPAYADIQIKNLTATGGSSAGVLIGLPKARSPM